MAISAQNVIVWYGNAIIRELQDLEVDSRRVEQDSYARGDIIVGPRTTGTLALRGFSMENLPQSEIGKWRIMAITVPRLPLPNNFNQRLVLWHGWARYDQCVTSAVRNGAVLFAFRFTLWEPFPTSGTIYPLLQL